MSQRICYTCYVSVLLFVLCLAVCGYQPAQAQSQTSKPAAKGAPPSGSPEMQAANKAASELLRERMKRDRPTDFAILKKVKESEIVVVRGTYDHVETVLSAVKVPHLVISPEDMDNVELNAGQLLLINCPGQLSDKAIEKVRKFVNAGGFLFTTDWSLQNVLEKAFPGFVEYTRKPTNDDVVAVRILKEDHTFLQHVKSTGDNPRWWLEGSSYPIHILDKKKVEVLMESDEMKRKYGEAPIAIHFKYGDGQVLHIVSHYYLQRTENRTASEKAKGTTFSKSLGMAKAPAAAEAELSKTTAGAVKDAYSAQQLSANIIVAKQKQNVELQKVYTHHTKEAAALRISPAANSGKLADLKKGVLLKVLEKKDAYWKVQTFSGDVGWVESKSVEKR